MLNNTYATKIVKNSMIDNPMPIILIMLRSGSGHSEHVFSLILSYFFLPLMMHSFHSMPVYPSAQLTGYSFVSLNPPKQASSLGHSMISVLFASNLQYPFERLICFPTHDA